MLRIHLLGNLRVFDGDVPLRLAAPPRVTGLWAYLLLHRAEAVPRDVLAFSLWPDEAEAYARANLRRHLYHLQRALPPSTPDCPWLLSENEAIRWNPAAPYWLDVADFERLSHDDGTLSEAVALYAGDLLEQIYDDWLFSERERLRALLLACLNRLMLRSRADRQFSQAIAFARQLLQHDPLREDVARELIALRYEAGDRAGALQEYERFTHLLRDELAVEPMPETTTLRDAILHNTRPPGSGLPIALTPAPGREDREQNRALLPFVGREVEITQLREWWRRAAHGQGRLAFVSGEAGIGKTRLTEELALIVEMEGGRVLRGAATFAAPTPYRAVVDALRAATPMIAALQINPVWLAGLVPLLPELAVRRPGIPALPPLDPDRERMRLLESFARCFVGLAQPRPLLLILEDLHWASAATVACLEFLARYVANQPLLILASYRDEETQRDHPLRALLRQIRSEDLGHHLALGRLSPPAVEKLIERLSGSALAASDLARRLYVQSEGLPLFLSELIRDRLTATGAILNDAAPTADVPPDLPHVIHTTITKRLTSLSDSARVLAEVAAVAGPAFSVELIREMAGWGEVETLDGLDELLDHHFVREAGTRQRYEYTFAHHLIQETIYAEIGEGTRRRYHRRAGRVIEQLYAAQVEELSGELALHCDRAQEPERAAGYYLRSARQALQVFADDEAQIAVARGLELTTDLPSEIALLLLEESILHRRGQRAPQRADLERLQTLTLALGEEELICETLSRQIRLERTLGERTAEANAITALKARVAAFGQSRWQAESLQADAAHYMLLGQYEAARASLHAALSLRSALGDVVGQIECYCLLAEIGVHQGQFDDVHRLLEQARSFPDSQANQSTLVWTLRAATIAAFGQQDFTLACGLGQQMLALAQSIGDREDEADAHMRLAMTTARLFRIDDARQHYRAAQELYNMLGKRAGEAAVLLNAAILSVRLGQYVEGMVAFQQAEMHFQALDDLRGQTVSAVNIAFAALCQGDYGRSKAAAVRGLQLAQSLSSRLLEATALSNLGAAERELGDLASGIAHMNAAIAIRRELGQTSDLGTDWADLTVAYLRAGDLPSARQAVEEMLALLETSAELMYAPQYLLWTIAQTYRALGEGDRAETYLSQAYTMLQEKAAVIPDHDYQVTFLQLPFNHEILAACEYNIWP